MTMRPPSHPGSDGSPGPDGDQVRQAIEAAKETAEKRSGASRTGGSWLSNLGSTLYHALSRTGNSSRQQDESISDQSTIKSRTYGELVFDENQPYWSEAELFYADCLDCTDYADRTGGLKRDRLNRTSDLAGKCSTGEATVSEYLASVAALSANDAPQNGPTKGIFYIVAEPNVNRAKLDDRLAAFLREHSFGAGGLDGDAKGSFGMIQDWDLDIVHYGAEYCTDSLMPPNVAAHNVAIADLGLVDRERIEVLDRLAHYRILDLRVHQANPD